MSLATVPKLHSLLPGVMACLEPREPRPILDWVAESVYFSAKISATPGYWNHNAYPYQKAVLLALADDDVDEVVLPWGTQLGKTSILGGYVGWRADQDPMPVIIGCPDEQSAVEHQATKMIPMLEAVDSLRHKVPKPRKRNKRNVDLGDQIIYYAWSGAKWTVSGRSAGVVVITEANLHSRQCTTEGDPVQMARDRAKAFVRRKVLIEGKPSEEGTCRVYAAYDQSNRQRYHVPCPHCGAYQVLEMGSKDSPGGLKWTCDPDGTLILDSVRYQCRHCQGKITDRHKPLMLAMGKWSPEGQSVGKGGTLTGEPARSKRISGFQLSSLYSIALSFADVVGEFLKCSRGSTEDLKNFVQGWLAETWKTQGKSVGDNAIDSHRAGYELGTLPVEPLAIVCTVDVQVDRLVYVVRAWGYGADSWLIHYGELPDWSFLDELAQRTFHGPDGGRHMVRLFLIDSADGNKSTEVYDYCSARHRVGRFVPIRGTRQYGQPSIVRISKVPERPHVPLWLIDPGQAFDQFYDRRLNIEPGQAGYWSIPKNAGSDYTRSLASWERTKEKTGAGVRMKWESKSKEHEHYADAEKMQEAAAFVFQFAFTQKPPDVNQKKPARSDNAVVRPDGRNWFER